MNYLVLSKVYKLVEDDCECENCRLDFTKVKNYEELEQLLIDYNYDYTPGQILIDVRYDSNIEEALATPNKLILTSDDKRISYAEIQFSIRWFCTNKAVIEVKDDKKYCKECFEKINKQLSFQMIKRILESKDEIHGLSTSQKIEYILIKNLGKKLTACQIYELGSPWDLKSLTPRNSVYARASSLYKEGTIKRDGILYFV